MELERLGDLLFKAEISGVISSLKFFPQVFLLLTKGAK